MNTVSIIVPIYNGAFSLKKIMSDICNQSYRDLEIILVDDGSTDESGQICEKWSLLDSRVKVIHSRHLGVSSARNIGLKIACGKYVQFVDSDDRLHNEMTQVLVDLIEESKQNMAMCGYFVKEGQNRKKKWFSKQYADKLALCNSSEVSYEIICNNLLGVLWNKLFIRDKITVFFDESISQCEDSIFCIHYYLDNPGIVVSDLCLYEYRYRAELYRNNREFFSQYRGLKKYYLLNSKLSNTIVDQKAKRIALNYSKKVFFYGVYTYLFESKTTFYWNKIRQKEFVNYTEGTCWEQVLSSLSRKRKNLSTKERVYLYLLENKKFYLMNAAVWIRRFVLKIKKCK